MHSSLERSFSITYLSVAILTALQVELEISLFSPKFSFSILSAITSSVGTPCKADAVRTPSKAFIFVSISICSSFYCNNYIVFPFLCIFQLYYTRFHVLIIGCIFFARTTTSFSIIVYPSYTERLSSSLSSTSPMNSIHTLKP